jgi:hypothetical protein
MLAGIYNPDSTLKQGYQKSGEAELRTERFQAHHA